MNANETKATGANAKQQRQARLSVVQPTAQEEREAAQAATAKHLETIERETPETPETPERPAIADQPVTPEATKPTKAAKPEKPPVDRLARVIEQQASPTRWQYARLAKAVKARVEAGQSYDDALSAVISQALEIVNGILAENPETSKDSDIDRATLGYFEATRPASMRMHGPKQTAEPTGE